MAERRELNPRYVELSDVVRDNGGRTRTGLTAQTFARLDRNLRNPSARRRTEYLESPPPSTRYTAPMHITDGSANSRTTNARRREARVLLNMSRAQNEREMRDFTLPPIRTLGQELRLLRGEQYSRTTREGRLNARATSDEISLARRHGLTGRSVPGRSTKERIDYDDQTAYLDTQPLFPNDPNVPRHTPPPTIDHEGYEVVKTLSPTMTYDESQAIANDIPDGTPPPAYSESQPFARIPDILKKKALKVKSKILNFKRKKRSHYPKSSPRINDLRIKQGDPVPPPPGGSQAPDDDISTLVEETTFQEMESTTPLQALEGEIVIESTNADPSAGEEQSLNVGVNPAVQTGPQTIAGSFGSDQTVLPTENIEMYRKGKKKRDDMDKKLGIASLNSKYGPGSTAVRKEDERVNEEYIERTRELRAQNEREVANVRDTATPIPRNMHDKLGKKKKKPPSDLAVMLARQQDQRLGGRTHSSQVGDPEPQVPSSTMPVVPLPTLPGGSLTNLTRSTTAPPGATGFGSPSITASLPVQNMLSQQHTTSAGHINRINTPTNNVGYRTTQIVDGSDVDSIAESMDVPGLSRYSSHESVNIPTLESPPESPMDQGGSGMNIIREKLMSPARRSEHEGDVIDEIQRGGVKRAPSRPFSNFTPGFVRSTQGERRYAPSGLTTSLSFNPTHLSIPVAGVTTTTGNQKQDAIETLINLQAINAVGQTGKRTFDSGRDNAVDYSVFQGFGGGRKRNGQ